MIVHVDATQVTFVFGVATVVATLLASLIASGPQRVANAFLRKRAELDDAERRRVRFSPATWVDGREYSITNASPTTARVTSVQAEPEFCLLVPLYELPVEIEPGQQLHVMFSTFAGGALPMIRLEAEDVSTGAKSSHKLTVTPDFERKHREYGTS